MATTHTNSGAPTFDAGFEQVKELNDQFLTAARRAGNLYLDSYEKAVDRAIKLELKAAEATQQEWLIALIEAQADFARELTSSYAAAARGVLK